MKKSKIDPLVLTMGCTENLMPDPAYAVSDNDIISRLDIFESIHETDAEGRTLLMYAALYERYAVVQYLLALKADIHAKDRNQYTALHFAVQTGNGNVINSLIEAGADVNAKDKFGNSPLMRCNSDVSISVIEMLLKSGANPFQKNDYGMSASDMFATQNEIMGLIDSFK